MRIMEIAKVKGKKLLMEKVKFEFTAILPGVVAETSQDQEKIFVNEPRLAIAMNVWISHLKGKQ